MRQGMANWQPSLHSKVQMLLKEWKEHLVVGSWYMGRDCLIE
jgi:hypothetical protein